MRRAPVPSFRPIAAPLAIALVVACAQTPPAPRGGDSVAVSVARAAAVDVAGVRVAASRARDLPRQDLDGATFVLVAVENTSGRPLRLRWADVVLASDAGPRASALPAHLVDDAGALPLAPRFDARAFRVAQPYVAVFPSLPPWSGPFDVDVLFQEKALRGWPIALPAGDVRARMLPEGVLEDGGRLTGLLAFERMPDDVPRTSLVLLLVDATTGEPFGRLEAPLAL